MAPRPRENSQQKRETQCTELYAALEMVRDTATDRAPRAFKEQALGSRRAERASEPRKGRPQRASEPNTKPGGVRVVCALRFYMSTKRIFKKSSGATRARSLCFIPHLTTFHTNTNMSCAMICHCNNKIKYNTNISIGKPGCRLYKQPRKAI